MSAKKSFAPDPFTSEKLNLRNRSIMESKVPSAASSKLSSFSWFMSMRPNESRFGSRLTRMLNNEAPIDTGFALLNESAVIWMEISSKSPTRGRMASSSLRTVVSAVPEIKGVDRHPLKTNNAQSRRRATSEVKCRTSYRFKVVEPRKDIRCGGICGTQRHHRRENNPSDQSFRIHDESAPGFADPQAKVAATGQTANLRFIMVSLGSACLCASKNARIQSPRINRTTNPGRRPSDA